MCCAAESSRGMASAKRTSDAFMGIFNMIVDLVHLHTGLRSWNLFNWAVYKRAPQPNVYVDESMKYQDWAPPIAVPELRSGKYQVLEVSDASVALPNRTVSPLGGTKSVKNLSAYLALV